MAESFSKRLQRAFKWHWNLLFLGAGVVVGLLSDSPDVVLPAVLAGELGYLGFLGLNERFQNVLRGSSLLKKQDDTARVRQLVDFLSSRDHERFQSLQRQCRELTLLQRRLDSQRATGGGSGDRFRAESLDKLLWLFLKLLYQKAGIERFFEQTDGEALGVQLEEATKEVAQAKTEGRSERLIQSLTEKRATLESRMANYQQATENVDLLAAEIDSTEQKIVHLCEVGMSTRDSSNLSHQIDGIAQSVALSEKALGDLDLKQFLPEDAPPPLISQETTLPTMSLVEME